MGSVYGVYRGTIIVNILMFDRGHMTEYESRDLLLNQKSGIYRADDFETGELLWIETLNCSWNPNLIVVFFIYITSLNCVLRTTLDYKSKT